MLSFLLNMNCSAVPHSVFHGLQGLHHACFFPSAKPKAFDFEVTIHVKGFLPFERLFSYS